MPYAGDTYSLPAGTAAVSNSTANSSHVNSRFSDLETAQNAPRPIAAGGTGATSEGAARSNLGLVIGTDVQAYDAGLTDIAAITPTDGTFLVGNGTTWVAESGAVARTSMGVPAVINDIASATTANVLSASATKSYVDGINDDEVTTSGTSVSFAIPAGVSRIRLVLNGVSLSGTDNVLFQASTSSAYVTTGYAATNISTNSTSVATFSSTAGFLITVGNAADALTGSIVFERLGATNEWVAVGQFRRDATKTSRVEGGITLAGELDGIRIITSGSDTLDAGRIAAKYSLTA